MVAEGVGKEVSEMVRDEAGKLNYLPRSVELDAGAIVTVKEYNYVKMIGLSVFALTVIGCGFWFGGGESAVVLCVASVPFWLALKGLCERSCSYYPCADTEQEGPPAASTPDYFKDPLYSDFPGNFFNDEH